MSLEQHPKIQEVIENGYQFDMGKYISQGIDIFKKNIGNFVGYTVLFFFLLVVTSLIPFIGMISYFLLMPVLSVGFYLVAHELDRNQNVEFGDFFRGFDYTGQLVLTFLVMTFAFMLFLGPFMYSVFSSSFFDSNFLLEETPSFPNFQPWTLLLFIPMIYLSIVWRWAPLFIVFHKMNFWDALETSRKLMSKKFGMMLLFAILIGILGGIGYIALLVGIFFTYPAAMCMDYAAFADITKLNEEESENDDDIVDHLIE